MTKSTATSRKLGRNAQHTFHLMVSGHSHSGKSSFCRTLAHSLAHSDDARLLINAPNSANDNGVASVIEENLLLADNLHLLFDKPAPLYRNNNNNSANTSSKDIISPTPLSGDIEFGYEYGGIGERVRLRLIDTPGLAIPVNIHKEMASSPSIHHESIATAWTNSISSYIEKIFEKTLMEESKVKRNRKNPDHHVHALIYLLDPMVIAACKGLTPIDILCMTALCSRVNLVPVIAKTDLLSVKQLAVKKKKKKKLMTE